MFEYFDKLNEDLSHYSSTNDICTPMGCVKEIVDNIPDELWYRDNIKILDPCAGNGNFPAYLETKTDSCNIYANEINKLRLKNLRDYFVERIHIYNNDFLTMDENDKYDLIIANVTSEIDTSNYQLINVESFSELVDIHDNIGVPILYYEEKQGNLCYFSIIKDNVLYRYKLENKQ